MSLKNIDFKTNLMKLTLIEHNRENRTKSNSVWPKKSEMIK
jgi:hypothetical protein